MQALLPMTRDLVLIGGGHAHALLLRMWGMNPLPGTRVTLINPQPVAPYTGMLPGHVAGHYPRDALDIDLVRLARFAGARIILSPATRIDPAARMISVEGRSDIAYDVASIDIGIHSAMPHIEGFDSFAVPAKPLGAFATRWRAFLDDAAAGRVAPDVAVIGGGVAGVELALAMAHALRRDAGPSTRVRVIETAAQITANTPAARRHLLSAMADLGVTALTGARVTRVTRTWVDLADGNRVDSAFTVGAAGAFAHGWLAKSPLPLTPEGFVRVVADLRVEGQDTLFAVGDCAHLAQDPRPKAGVFAVRAAPVLLDNVRALLSGGRTRPFRPQRHYLKLISLGGQSALAEKWGLSLAAPSLWRWKDGIDRRFMAKFTDYPRMPAAPLPRLAAAGVVEELQGIGKPLCGGCGSKIGPEALSQALAALPPVGRKDVLSGPGDDAAILEVGGVRQVVTTDHLRAFTNDHGLMARITAVHAMGDIWAMGAQPQAALVSVILPRMSPQLQARSMAEIMSAAQQVFASAGADIVGGHSTMGAELTLGFTLTGLVSGSPVSLGGARLGDRLILTRPIGTGTLLAAEMQGQADGRDVAEMLAVMARPQGDAAELLRAAHAMTDVTGFGLAGHLMAICRASGTAAQIDPAAVPVYDGALALAEAGHRSTIWNANRSAAPVAGASGARGILLHDPQTSGGLLAAVDPETAKSTVTALRAAGHRAEVIGTIIDGPPAIRCV